jgi:hypothetical protein
VQFVKRGRVCECRSLKGQLINLNSETVVQVIWYGYELSVFLCDEHKLKVFEYRALENVRFEEG